MKELYYLYTGDTGYSDRRRGPHDRLTNTKNIWGDCSKIRGDASGLTGDVSTVYGDVSGIWGKLALSVQIHATGLFGDIADFRKIQRQALQVEAN